MKFNVLSSKFCFLFLTFTLTFLFVSNSYAAHPLITDDTGTQGKGKSQLEVNGEYSNDNGNTITEISATFSAGIRDNIDFVITVPYQFLRTKDEAGHKTSENGISDMTIEMKWRFYEKDGLSLALKPGIIFSTGDADKGLGDGKNSYSLFFITTKEMEPFTFHVNLGYIKNRKELRDIWHYSLAVEYKVTKPLRIVANVGGETNPDWNSHVHPLFLLGGVIYSVSENFDIDFGVKTGLNKAEADYTLLAGIMLRF
ncbi:MAG: transporter [Nitrospirota bacterium]|nr:transporter [Nitrospirota bacterium]MDH5768118.1 transporter [Nitrospirota bacterium]